MLPILHTFATPVDGQDVNVQVIHARTGVYARNDRLRPVPSDGQIQGLAVAVSLCSVHSFLARLIQSRELAVASLQFFRHQPAQLLHLRLHVFQELRIVERFERVQQLLRRVARQEQNVDGGFGEQIVDHDPFLIMVDDPRSRERSRRGDVGA